MITLEKQTNLIHSILGNDFLEEIKKAEVYKPFVNVAVDPMEVKVALQIVPRAVLGFLMAQLKPMEKNGIKTIDLAMFDPGSFLEVNKLDKDVYMGTIYKEGKILNEFKYRTIPGIGLVVMSTFELYDLDVLKDVKEDTSMDTNKIQDMIDERFALHHLVKQIVDEKLKERDHIGELIRAKLTEAHVSNIPQEEEEMEEDKPMKLKAFLDKRKKKNDKNEFHVTMDKSESVNCLDCGNEIFSKGAYSGCICMGHNMSSKIYIKKSENGYSLRFNKNWDPENIEMLLQTIKDIKNRTK